MTGVTLSLFSGFTKFESRVLVTESFVPGTLFEENLLHTFSYLQYEQCLVVTKGSS